MFRGITPTLRPISRMAPVRMNYEYERQNNATENFACITKNNPKTGNNGPLRLNMRDNNAHAREYNAHLPRK